MKQLQILCVLAIFLLLFGCINTNDNSISKMNDLQAKYLMKSGFSTSPSVMTEYISSLSELRTSASNENKKIIEAELYLAESFNYQNKTLVESSKLNYIYFNCSSTEAKAMINFNKLADSSINLAEKTFNELNDSQKETLRTNYSTILLGYKENITLMKEFIDNKC